MLGRQPVIKLSQQFGAYEPDGRQRRSIMRFGIGGRWLDRIRGQARSRAARQRSSGVDALSAEYHRFRK